MRFYSRMGWPITRENKFLAPDAESVSSALSTRARVVELVDTQVSEACA